MPQVTDFILQRLKEWGIHRIYGFPGDGINGFLGALDRADGDPKFIQTRHEENAAFMACAEAKWTGDLGVCMATSGPGAIHLLNGIYDARLDHQPVLAIVGQQKRYSVGAHYQQEVDLTSLFKDATEYVHYVMDQHSARHVLDRAIKTALTERAPVCIIVPDDVQEMEYADPPRQHGAVFSSVGWNRPRILPHDEDLKKAADVLNAGEKVAILIGQGAQGAGKEVVEVADLLGAGVAKALLGKDAVPDTLPFVTGSLGLLGTEASHKMIMNCDTLFMIGTSFPYTEWLPEEGAAKCVEIDIDGRMIGIRYPVDAPLVGDAKETLTALMPYLKRKEDRSWQEMIIAEVATHWRVQDDKAAISGDPMNPQLVAHELSPRLPDYAIVSADSGSSTTWYARHLKFREGMRGSLSGTLATMGPGVPYAIAAKFAYPDRPSIAFVGDGAFQMLGMNELLTVQRYWQTWDNPTLIFAVFVNRDLNQVSYEQRVLAADRKFYGSQSVPYLPAAEFAKMLGFEGIRVDNPKDMGHAWDDALAAKKPVVLECIVDPTIPPLPPHVKPSQMKKTVTSFLKGDPEAYDIAEKGFKAKMTELVEHIPGREKSK